jgi:hypothetical protein
MHRWAYVLLSTALAVAGCSTHKDEANTQILTPARSAAVEDGVREFLKDVARDVTAEGPIAWTKYFENSPAFFMAVNGKMAFPSGAAAMGAIPDVAKTFKSIDLQWGDDLRVDPLTPTLAGVATSYREVLVDATGHRIEANGFFTGTAEYQGGRWQFRNAHWSAPTSAVP